MFGVPKSGTLVTYLEIIGKVSTNTSFYCHIPYELDIIARTCLTYQCSTRCHRNLYLTVPIYVCGNYFDSDPYYSQQHVLSILFQVGGNACIWGGLAQQSPCF